MVCGIGVILFVLGIIKDFTTPYEMPNAYEEGIIPENDIQLEQYAEALMDRLKTGDFSDERVQKMFCEDTLNNYDVTKQLTEASKFIEGNIVSYDEPDGASTGKSVADGITLYYESVCRIHNVVTDKGKKYNIITWGYYESHEHPEREGVMKITIIDLGEDETSADDNKEFTIGNKE